MFDANNQGKGQVVSFLTCQSSAGSVAHHLLSRVVLTKKELEGKTVGGSDRKDKIRRSMTLDYFMSTNGHVSLHYLPSFWLMKIMQKSDVLSAPTGILASQVTF